MSIKWKWFPSNNHVVFIVLYGMIHLKSFLNRRHMLVAVCFARTFTFFFFVCSAIYKTKYLLLWCSCWLITLRKMSVLFWGVTQRLLEIYCRRFGATYQSHLQRSRITHVCSFTLSYGMLWTYIWFTDTPGVFVGLLLFASSAPLATKG